MTGYLTLYSDILQLQTGAFRTLKQSNRGLRYALQMLLVVSLLAGAGKLASFVGLFEQPTAPQVVENIADRVRQFHVSLVDAVPGLIPIYVEVWFPLDIEQVIVQYMDELLSPIEAALNDTKELAVELEPPVGVHTNRALQLVGDWLATPLQLVNRWILFALVTLLLAKWWGGSGTLRQHVSLLALASAPYIFMFPAYLPQEGALGLAAAYFGRVVALLVAIWAAAIGVKAISTAHNLPASRAAGVLALGLFIHYVAAPFIVAAVLVYLVF